jgi:hypothetical protein
MERAFSELSPVRAGSAPVGLVAVPTVTGLSSEKSLTLILFRILKANSHHGHCERSEAILKCVRDRGFLSVGVSQ